MMTVVMTGLLVLVFVTITIAVAITGSISITILGSFQVEVIEHQVNVLDRFGLAMDCIVYVIQNLRSV